MIIEHIIGFSIRYRWLVLLAALGVAALGVYNFERLPIDAVPDIRTSRSKSTRPRMDSLHQRSSDELPIQSKPRWREFRDSRARVR